MESVPYIVEFNWLKEQFHIAPLYGHLSKQIALLLIFGQPPSSGWMTIGVTTDAVEAQEFADDFPLKWQDKEEPQ